MDTLNHRLKRLRTDLDLNQVEFAKRLGVTNAHISKIEKGNTTPSSALVKLICKEFNISERWLVDGVEPINSFEVDYDIDQILTSTTQRLNAIRTRDILPIRSRVAQIEELFVEILEITNTSEDQQKAYLDICYKLFYHINSYLTFQKKSLSEKQLHVFPFPDDLVQNIKKDIEEFEIFFNETEMNESNKD